jgi:hypothetical protein
MEISKTPKITPDAGSPPEVSAQEVWTQLVPRLLNPATLAIIEALLRERQPLSPTELSGLVDLSVGHARYHCDSMKSRGALEVVHHAPRPDGDGDEPSYYFSTPAQAASSPSPSQRS